MTKPDYSRRNMMLHRLAEIRDAAHETLAMFSEQLARIVVEPDADAFLIQLSRSDNVFMHAAVLSVATEMWGALAKKDTKASPESILKFLEDRLLVLAENQVGQSTSVTGTLATQARYAATGRVYRELRGVL